jgi:hypothetical protein
MLHSWLLEPAKPDTIVARQPSAAKLFSRASQRDVISDVLYSQRARTWPL